MKKTVFMLKMMLFCFLAANSGCEPAPPRQTPQKQSRRIHSSFAPDKIEIMPLTEMTVNNKQNTKIKAYVSLLDSFNCQKKWPGIFRFELYERILRSSEPKGKRLFIWPDFDLTDPALNNNHWLDFLRAYEFNLEFEPAETHDYILLVTCLSPDNKRLSTELILKPQQKP